MSTGSDQRLLVPSILDRLVDRGWGRPQSGGAVRMRELRESVRHDLQSLLNARCRCVSYPPDLKELAVSAVTYGLPDFSTTASGVQSFKAEFRKRVEETIRRFEPRIKSVSVVLLEQDDEISPQLRFRIDAVLYADPAPEPVTFASELEPVTGEVSIRQQ